MARKPILDFGKFFRGADRSIERAIGAPQSRARSERRQRTPDPAVQKAREWEYKNLVYGKGYYDKTKGSGGSLENNMRTRGYDVMRVSPQKTERQGRQYRAVYGGTVEPNYNAPTSERNQYGKPTRFAPRVEWHRQGYVRARDRQRTGTVRLQNLRDYPIDQRGLTSRLMERKRRR
jgi:hypothetical protein